MPQTFSGAVQSERFGADVTFCTCKQRMSCGHALSEGPECSSNLQSLGSTLQTPALMTQTNATAVLLLPSAD